MPDKGRLTTLTFGVLLGLSFLLLASPGLRRGVHRFGVRPLASPLLKAEAVAEDLYRLQALRDSLSRVRAAQVLGSSPRIQDLWKASVDSLVLALPLAFDPPARPRKAILSAGEAEGVHEGAVLLLNGALVGKVVRTGPHTSEVWTLLNPSLRVGVIFPRTRDLGILEGGDPPVVRYVALSAPLQVGDTLVTSGLGGVFPPGIPIGTAAEIRSDQAGIFLEVPVRLFEDLHRAGGLVIRP